MTKPLADFTDEEFADIIYRALLSGCGHPTYFESHELGLIVDGIFFLDNVAKHLRHALEGQPIDNLVGHIPPWKKWKKPPGSRPERGKRRTPNPKHAFEPVDQAVFQLQVLAVGLLADFPESKAGIVEYLRATADHMENGHFDDWAGVSS